MKAICHRQLCHYMTLMFYLKCYRKTAALQDHNTTGRLTFINVSAGSSIIKEHLSINKVSVFSGTALRTHLLRSNHRLEEIENKNVPYEFATCVHFSVPVWIGDIPK